MTIKRITNNLTTAEGVKMYVSDNIVPLKNFKEQTITIIAMAEIETTDKDGKDIEILSLLLDDYSAVCTTSITFKNMFFKLIDFLKINVMEKFCISLKIISGTSKSQREFLTCEYVSHEGVE